MNCWLGEAQGISGGREEPGAAQRIGGRGNAAAAAAAALRADVTSGNNRKRQNCPESAAARTRPRWARRIPVSLPPPGPPTAAPPWPGHPGPAEPFSFPLLFFKIFPLWKSPPGRPIRRGGGWGSQVAQVPHVVTLGELRRLVAPRDAHPTFLGKKERHGRCSPVGRNLPGHGTFGPMTAQRALSDSCVGLLKRGSRVRRRELACSGCF